MVKTRFWKDVWLGNPTLADQFPRLFHLTFDKDITMAKVYSDSWGSIRFRGLLWGETLQSWQELQSKCADIQFGEEQDKVVWMLDAKGNFTVKSFYSQFKARQRIFTHRHLWKIQVPLN